jgi:hypothetical protein
LVLEEHQILQGIIQYLLVSLVQVAALVGVLVADLRQVLQAAQAVADLEALELADRGVLVLLGKARQAVEVGQPQQQTWEPVAAVEPVEQAVMVLMCLMVVLVVLDWNPVLLAYQLIMPVEVVGQAVVQVGWVVAEQQQQLRLQHQLVGHQTRVVVVEPDLVTVVPDPSITPVRLVDRA